MHTDAHPTVHPDLNSHTDFTAHYRGIPDLCLQAGSECPALSERHWKDYSHILSDTDFDTRWEFDDEYSDRCYRSRIELYEHIVVTLHGCRRASDRGMSEYERDWLACAHELVRGIEASRMPYQVHCLDQIARITTLAMKLPELCIASQQTSARIRQVRTFLATGSQA